MEPDQLQPISSMSRKNIFDKKQNQEPSPVQDSSCPKCNRMMPPDHLIPSPSDPTLRICYDCVEDLEILARNWNSAALILEHLDEWIRKNLKTCGVPLRPLDADPDKVPVLIKKRLPKAVLEDILAGRIPTAGFGLGGEVGGGKTCCIVALLKLCLKAYAEREIPKCPQASWSDRLTFVNWPYEVDWIRKHATDEDTTERIESLCSIPLLVLDDLGRERIRGDYSTDWAANQLDVILNYREFNRLPTLWTTNVPESELVSIYGPSMMNRLTGDNPLIWVDGLRCLRGV